MTWKLLKRGMRVRCKRAPADTFEVTSFRLVAGGCMVLSVRVRNLANDQEYYVDPDELYPIGVRVLGGA